MEKHTSPSNKKARAARRLRNLHRLTGVALSTAAVTIPVLGLTWKIGGSGS